MRASAGVWAIVAASALLSCGSTRAAVFVRVDTDIVLPPEALRSVRVRVYSGFGPTRTPRHDSVRVVGGDGGVRFPFRFVVLPLGDDESRVVTVEVTGCNDAECGDPIGGNTPVVVEQRAIVSFIPEQQWELPIFLASSCRGVDCDSTDPSLARTCLPENGMCGPAQVTPGGRADAGADRSTADVDPSDAAEVGGQDATATDIVVAADVDATADAVSDADAARDGMDATAMDAAVDAGADVTTDAAVEVGTDAAMDREAAVTMDVAADTAMDREAAVTMDAAPDAGVDAAPDAAPDAGMDVVMDRGPDAAPDATPDAAVPDATPDAAPDAPRDVPLDSMLICGGSMQCRPQENCCILGGCGCVLIAVCTPRGVIGCL